MPSGENSRNRRGMKLYPFDGREAAKPVPVGQVSSPNRGAASASEPRRRMLIGAKGFGFPFLLAPPLYLGGEFRETILTNRTDRR